MDFKELINSAEYDFLRTEPRLGEHIMLLGVSGSYGYGTNREGSDVDLRGVTANLPSDLLGLTSFEQFEDKQTDTVIYAFNKIVKLLLNCNPNTIEILGLDDDQYLILTPPGRELIDNSELFLSKRAAASFGGYADTQLRRLQNAIARDSLSQSAREQHILTSMRHALDDFNRKHAADPCGKTQTAAAAGPADAGSPGMRARLYIDESVTEGLDKEIYLDADFSHYPLRRYNEMMNTLHSVVRDYDRIGKRNHKKDDVHLNKHAMHLIRLFMMGIDILEKKEIRTHRPPGDLRLLRSIRNGDYMKDGILEPAFYEIVTDYEKRFAQAEKNSSLPDYPDLEKAGHFVESMNRKILQLA